MTLRERLRSAAMAERLAAIAELLTRAQPADDELQTLADCLGGAPKVLQRRAAEAFAALQQRGVAVDDVLLAALHSPALQQRWGAVYALSLLGAAPALALPVLLESLGLPDGDVRWAAANILVHMERTPALIDTLCALLSSGNPAQRKMAAYCLRDLEAQSTEVQDALFTALEDPIPGVRLAAMSSLARLGADRAAVAQRVVARLHDADDGVRRAAAVVLGLLGERADPVIAALRAAAGSTDASLQRAAARALELLHA